MIRNSREVYGALSPGGQAQCPLRHCGRPQASLCLWLFVGHPTSSPSFSLGLRCRGTGDAPCSPALAPGPWFGVCLSWLSVVLYGGTWPPCPSSTSGQAPLLFQNMDRDLHAEDHRPSAPGGVVKTHVAGLSPSGKSVGLGATRKCSQVMLPLLLGGTPLENHRLS